MDAAVRAESEEREPWWREVMGVAAKGSGWKRTPRSQRDAPPQQDQGRANREQGRFDQ